METSLDRLKEEMTEKVISKLSNIRYMTSTEKEIYKAIDNDIYIEGKIGIYNNHASGLFKYIKIKGE